MRLVLAWLLLAMTPAALASAEGNYRLGSGDRIQIQVYGEEDLSIDGIRVGESGTISYPYLGTVRLAGRTVKEVENQILQGLKGDYLVNPSVSVSVIEYRPFFINGEVRRPGSYPFQPGLTVRQAIAIAGGLTERASSRGLRLVRADNGGERSLKVEMAFEVLPGDSIFIEDSFF
ncbi:polysaccharide biosynthesis/export family protein [Ferrimonas gelatinilytica]|uniref:Exopolysaccharide export protein VpsN n=1 Tax=Ferrimonas gelatinilytica TaxID=1255257 RepID=A0ABP9SBG3_9GAMM